MGAILAIKIDEMNDTIYFTGSDSKISTIKRTNDQWILGYEIRGQSHDIMSLQLYGNMLLSGGVSTDICFYRKDSHGSLDGNFQNRISYSNEE